MKKNVVRGILFALMTMNMVSCGFMTSADSSYEFLWDMSAENHTGIPKNLYAKDGKLRGMSAFRWREDVEESINQLIKNNIEWVAIVPFYYQENERTPEMRMPESIGKWSRRDSSFIETIHRIQERGLHIMLKPHLWMRDGWRSNITLKSDEEWDKWFDSYRLNMLHHAHMAEMCHVEMLCIGAEFMTSIKKQPHRWNALISEVKEVYSGKLTYAANWDAEYAEVTFWDEMDYIGIQAYFPLTNNHYPNLKEIKKGWNPHIKMLEALSEKYDKPILFTEIGYRSDHVSTIEPWVWGASQADTSIIMSYETQNLAYEALFQKLWDKNWFAGMFFWQWHNVKYDRNKVYENKDFTPRFKPAENTMAKWYGKENY